MSFVCEIIDSTENDEAPYKPLNFAIFVEWSVLVSLPVYTYVIGRDFPFDVPFFPLFSFVESSLWFFVLDRQLSHRPRTLISVILTKIACYTRKVSLIHCPVFNIRHPRVHSIVFSIDLNREIERGRACFLIIRLWYRLEHRFPILIERDPKMHYLIFGDP